MSSSPRPASPVATASSDHDDPAIAGSTIQLQFLLADGSRFTRAFPEALTCEEIKEQLYAEKEDGKEDAPAGLQRAQGKDSLRILYLGRFLDDSTSLQSLNLEKDGVTTFHLHIRAPPPSTLEEEDLKPQNKETEKQGCCGCVIV